MVQKAATLLGLILLGVGGGRLLRRAFTLAGQADTRRERESAWSSQVEAVLDFLGLGLSPDIPSWGNMLAQSEQYLSTNPMTSIIPGSLLTLAILAVNFVGDGLRDAFDPRTK